MSGFISFAEPLKKILESITSSIELHSKWLNTLSFLENCGARKIAACEHPRFVQEQMLKHAAEEFRHAHHLKRQIRKISDLPMETYSRECILGGMSTFHYLSALDLKTSRYLSNLGFSKSSVKEMAYLLVTYAIECRAGELYLIYDQILKDNHSPVSIKSILLEEKEHLAEMEDGIHKLPLGRSYARHICALEGALCGKWIGAIKT